MIATNVCEWLYVLIEETKHEIVHLSGKNLIRDKPFNKFLICIIEHHATLINSTSHNKHCDDRNVFGVVVTNASTFLFPCTIEYSLICAVILFEMWKHIETIKKKEVNNNIKRDKNLNRNAEKILDVLRISEYYALNNCLTSVKLPLPSNLNFKVVLLNLLNL